MTYKYENSLEDIMRILVECAYQDREGMCGSLLSSGKKLSDDDQEYLRECESFCRDFIRFAHNRNIEVFHPNSVKALRTPLPPKPEGE